MSYVIEHVHRPLPTLIEIFHIMRPGGTLALTTPNAESCGATPFRGRLARIGAAAAFTESERKHPSDVGKMRRFCSIRPLDHASHYIVCPLAQPPSAFCAKP